MIEIAATLFVIAAIPFILYVGFWLVLGFTCVILYVLEITGIAKILRWCKGEAA